MVERNARRISTVVIYTSRCTVSSVAGNPVRISEEGLSDMASNNSKSTAGDGYIAGFQSWYVLI